MSRLAVQHVLKQQRSITWLSTLMDPDNFFFFFLIKEMIRMKTFVSSSPHSQIIQILDDH